MNLKFWHNLFFLRLLASFWGWVTIIIFCADFFSSGYFNSSISGVSIIYGTILALYVGSKEYQRWCQKNNKFISHYFGELYVIIWTVIMVFFVALAPFSRGLFKVPGEFTAVYLTVISVFILSQQSKNLKKEE